MLMPLLMKNSAKLPPTMVPHSVPAQAKPACRPVPAPLKEPTERAARKPLVIGVIGAKGGVGATTTCLNLAAAIARNGKQATMIDANLQMPDAAVILGADVKYGLLELIQKSTELDEQFVEACSLPISKGARLISAPLSGAAALKVQASDIAECVTRASALADAWLIDLPKHLDRHLVTLMDKCDRLVLVFEPTIAAVHATRRWQDVFRELGYDNGRIIYVINRCGGKVRTVERQLEQLPAFGSTFSIPNAFELIEKAAARGELALQSNERAPYSVAMIKLAESLLSGGEHG